MEYRLDRRSGDELSVLGMGCMRLPRKGAGIDMQLTELILLEAFERGVNYFDTAYSYGGSEEALGEVVERSVNRGRVRCSFLNRGRVRCSLVSFCSIRDEFVAYSLLVTEPV